MLILLQKRKRISSLKDTIIKNIEENQNSWAKAAFYSDEDVSKIMERLINEWERNNQEGIPMDYATEEELEVLAEKSEEYKHYTQETFVRTMMKKSMGYNEDKSK